jgi:sulfotransferase
MNKTLHFLSGLPRSGSTVLAAILNQNPETHVSTTSGLTGALGSLVSAWKGGILGGTDPDKERLVQTMRGTIDAFYETTNKPVVIDKSRGWPTPNIMQTMARVIGDKPKIIATVRSVPDCMASFVRVAKPENLDEFMQTSPLTAHLKESYIHLEQGIAAAPECFLVVEYDDLIDNPEKELDRIHEFLGLEPFAYDFDNIDGESVKEDDEKIHGVAGLHDIKPKLEKQHREDPKITLGAYYNDYCQPEFWLETPRTVQVEHDLDRQLAAGKRGDFVEGRRLMEKLKQEEPDNLRATYNSGWYLHNQGKILDAYKAMDEGRKVGVFGNAAPDVPTDKWDGVSKGVVLLNLEGGLGDQIHQIRYAKNIADRGCTVIVACSGQLVQLFTKVEGVTAVIQHEAAFGVFHDFWVAGMSAIVPLGLELNDLSGKPYIHRNGVERAAKKRVGLRWQAGTLFEHEHNKTFPYELMFEAVKGLDVEFISLQRDEGEEARPSWVKEVPLDNWGDTKAAIDSCDLVISACTSVSHLSAAMGVETWVITPVLPYFLYSIVWGDRTPYYNDMKLFRQEEFGKWEAPFNLIKKQLQPKKEIEFNIVPSSVLYCV